MKLTEISIRHTSTVDAAFKHLVNLGKLKPLGQGGQGRAFELADGRVLKCWISDFGYEAYIEAAMTMQDNPYVIKVLSKIKTFKLHHRGERDRYGMTADRTVKCVAVEKLQPFTASELAKFQAPTGLSADSFASILKNSLDKREWRLSLDDTLKRYGDDLSEPFIKLVTGLYSVMQKIGTDGVDITAANLGMRGSQVVLLDPLSPDMWGSSDA